VVVKPARSFGGRGITFVSSPVALGEAIEQLVPVYGEVFLQERIPVSTKYTAGCLCNADGELRRICILRELRNYPLETGPASCVETVEHPEIAAYCEDLLASLHFTGIADIDFVEDRRDGRPKLMEINPRFWGSLSGAIRAGVDFPHLLYRMAREGDVERSMEYRKGVRARNVIFYEFRRLRQILYGDYISSYKWKSLLEFFQFYRDDAYFVFSPDDYGPFLSMLAFTFRNKLQGLGNALHLASADGS
jgi:predicted ATP-grasp superfamily ATP-dependent carboligase